MKDWEIFAVTPLLDSVPFIYYENEIIDPFTKEANLFFLETDLSNLLPDLDTTPNPSIIQFLKNSKNKEYRLLCVTRQNDVQDDGFFFVVFLMQTFPNHDLITTIDKMIS